MIPFGKILKFKSYDAEKLDRMKHDLALSAPSSLWQYCRQYYGNHAKRDPYVEELKLLDRLFLSLQAEPGLIAIHELYTNDTVVAETYADMMQKRNELGLAGAPVTLGMLLNLASAYLMRAGKKTPCGLPLIFTDPSINKTHLLTANASSKKNNDAFLLLSPDTEKEETVSDLDSLLECNAFTVLIKDMQSLAGHGILSLLLRDCDAFRIDLNAVCDRSDPVFAVALTRPINESYLIRIPQEAEEALRAIAQEYGYCAKTIAFADEGGLMTALYDQKELFTLEASFLKTLFPQQTITAKLSNEADGSLVPSESDAEPPLALATDAFCCNRIDIAPQNAFFTNVFYSALLAVIKQSLCGSEHSQQLLFVKLRIPKVLNEKAGGAILSAVVAIYRMQAELGMLLSPPSIKVDKAIGLPALSLVTCGDGAPLPTKSPTESNATYHLRIGEAENGLPDFAALRSLLKTLCKLRREGILCAASARISADTPNALITVVLECNTPIEGPDFAGFDTLHQEESAYSP